MLRILKISFSCLFITNIIMAQSAFYLSDASRFARSIRLGNAYTGVAEGPEAMFYNAAGITSQDAYGFVFSEGQGFAILMDGVKAFDYAITAPLPNHYGVLGVSINTLSMKPSDDYKSVENIYSINYARKFLYNLSFGITASYYHIKVTNQASLLGLTSVAGSAFDINLSSLYEIPGAFIFSENDALKIGFQIKNILNTKVKYDNTSHTDYKFQNIRIGASYSYMPELDKAFDLSPLEFMAAFDAVFLGSNYDFINFQPNFGVELRLFEILQVSYGREVEKQIRETYTYSPQHPVNRYGIGIKAPLQKFVNLPFAIELKVDYSVSDWKKLDEEKDGLVLGGNRRIDNKAISAGLNIKF